MISLNLAGILDVVANQELLLGVFLAGAGLIVVLFGQRISRPLVSVSFGVLGFVLCGSLPVPDEIKSIFGFAGAIGLGAASTFFPQLSVSVLAGAWAFYAGLLLGVKLEIFFAAALGLGAISSITAISLSLIMRREMIALTLSLEGTLLLIGGLIVFLNQSPILWAHIRDLLVNTPIFPPFLLLAGTVTGFYFQLAEQRQRDAGSSG